MFNPTDHILINKFLVIHEQTCDFNSIHDVAVACFVTQLMTSSAAASPASGLYFEYKKFSDEPRRMMLSWKEVVSDLPRSHATDEVISKTEMEMRNFQIPSDMKPNQDAKAPWTKVLRRSQVYTELTPMSIHIH